MNTENQKLIINSILESLEIYLCVVAATAYNCATEGRVATKEENKTLAKNRAKLIDLITANMSVE